MSTWKFALSLQSGFRLPDSALYPYNPGISIIFALLFITTYRMANFLAVLQASDLDIISSRIS